MAKRVNDLEKNLGYESSIPPIYFTNFKMVKFNFIDVTVSDF